MKTQSAALLASLLLTAASAPAFADEQPFTFKSLTLGAVPAPGELERSVGVNFSQNALAPCKRTPGIQYTCRGSVAVRNHETETMVTIGADGTVQGISIWFQAPFFEDLEAGAIQQYGARRAAAAACRCKTRSGCK